MPAFRVRTKLLILLVVGFLGTYCTLLSPAFVEPLSQVVDRNWWQEWEFDIELTEDSPTFTCPVTIGQSCPELRIEDLSTNGTAVMLRAQTWSGHGGDPWTPVVWLNNVTTIENVTILFSASPDVLSTEVVVTRLDGDVQVSLKIGFWDYTRFRQWYATDPIPPLLLLLALYGISRLEIDRSKLSVALVVSVVLIGAALTAQLEMFRNAGHFRFVHREVVGMSQDYMFSINTSSASAVLDLSEFDASAGHYLRIHSLNTSGQSVSLNVSRVGSLQSMLIANLTTYGRYGLLLLVNRTDGCTTQISRLEDDTVVRFTLETFNDVLVQYSDPLSSEVLATVGFFVTAIGFWIANRISDDEKAETVKLGNSEKRVL